MADPITLGIMSAAATGLQMAGQVAQGAAQADAYGAKADAAATAAEYGRAKAYATNSAMQEDLRATLGNIMAVRAAAGTNPSSPTGQAVMANVRGDSNRDRKTAVGNIRAQASQNDRAASVYAKAGRNAILTGLLGAASTGVKASGPVLKGLV